MKNGLTKALQDLKIDYEEDGDYIIRIVRYFNKRKHSMNLKVISEKEHLVWFVELIDGQITRTPKVMTFGGAVDEIVNKLLFTSIDIED